MSASRGAPAIDPIVLARRVAANNQKPLTGEGPAQNVANSSRNTTPYSTNWYHHVDPHASYPENLPL